MSTSKSKSGESSSKGKGKGKEKEKEKEWTWQQNKDFEVGLAMISESMPNDERWRLLAALVPGKTESDVKLHYQKLADNIAKIEAGLVPLPKYDGLKRETKNSQQD